MFNRRIKIERKSGIKYYFKRKLVVYGLAKYLLKAQFVDGTSSFLPVFQASFVRSFKSSTLKLIFAFSALNTLIIASTLASVRLFSSFKI